MRGQVDHANRRAGRIAQREAIWQEFLDRIVQLRVALLVGDRQQQSRKRFRHRADLEQVISLHRRTAARDTRRHDSNAARIHQCHGHARGPVFGNQVFVENGLDLRVGGQGGHGQRWGE